MIIWDHFSPRSIEIIKVTQYRKEVVPSAQKSEAKKMLKNRLTLTIFGRFLEGNLNFDHIWTAQFHFDHIWTAQYITLTIFGRQFGGKFVRASEVNSEPQTLNPIFNLYSVPYKADSR